MYRLQWSWYLRCAPIREVSSFQTTSLPCSKKQNLIRILENIAADSVKANGFFHSGPELECNKLYRPAK